MAHLIYDQVVMGVYLFCCFYGLVYLIDINVLGVIAKIIAKPVAQL